MNAVPEVPERFIRNAKIVITAIIAIMSASVGAGLGAVICQWTGWALASCAFGGVVAAAVFWFARNPWDGDDPEDES